MHITDRIAAISTYLSETCPDLTAEVEVDQPRVLLHVTNDDDVTRIFSLQVDTWVVLSSDGQPLTRREDDAPDVPTIADWIAEQARA